MRSNYSSVFFPLSCWISHSTFPHRTMKCTVYYFDTLYIWILRLYCSLPNQQTATIARICIHVNSMVTWLWFTTFLLKTNIYFLFSVKTSCSELWVHLMTADSLNNHNNLLNYPPKKIMKSDKSCDDQFYSRLTIIMIRLHYRCIFLYGSLKSKE